MRLKANPNKALAELCRRSFYRFLQEFWEVVIPETPVYNWHIQYLCNELQYLNSFVTKRLPKPYDLIINVPPGSTKSTIVTQMYNAWVWVIDPTQRIIASSYAHALSLSHSIKTRDIISSDKYKALFPEIELKKDQQGKSDFRTTKGGQRFTTSTGGTVTGMHAHQIIIDDPINPQQSASDVERESANNFITSTLSSRKVNKQVTPTILVMQRLHEEDPTGIMISQKHRKIRHICLPAELKLGAKVLPEEAKENYIDGLLDPVRLGREVLEQAKEDLGSYGYAGQYEQTPVDLAGGLIKKSWFEIIDGTWQNKIVNFVMDTAYTSKSDNDPSGFMAYYREGNDIVIVNWESMRLEFPDLTKYTVSFARSNGYTSGSSIRVEPKASGLSLVQQLRTETRLNISEDANPDKDKVTRATSITPALEAKRVKLLRGAWNERFLHEICTFPKAAHDEAVDCLVMAVNRELINNTKIFGYAVR